MCWGFADQDKAMLRLQSQERGSRMSQPVAASAKRSGFIVTAACRVVRLADGGGGLQIARVAAKYPEFNKKVPGMI